MRQSQPFQAIVVEFCQSLLNDVFRESTSLTDTPYWAQIGISFELALDTILEAFEAAFTLEVAPSCCLHARFSLNMADVAQVVRYMDLLRRIDAHIFTFLSWNYLPLAAPETDSTLGLCFQLFAVLFVECLPNTLIVRVHVLEDSLEWLVLLCDLLKFADRCTCLFRLPREPPEGLAYGPRRMKYTAIPFLFWFRVILWLWNQ